MQDVIWQILIADDAASRVAMVTAMSQQTMVMSTIKVGARGFVTKSFDESRVIDAVQKLIG